MRRGLDAVTAGSFCRSEPEAEFLGLAKGLPPAATIEAFSFSKSLRAKKTSPRISITAGWVFPLSLCGILGMVLMFSVTSSPTSPSPLVAAEVS